MGKETDLYKVLSVAPSVTADELKSAYRELARRYHPDHARTYIQKIAATRRMQAINAAYAVLRDPQRRAAYDAERSSPPGKTWTWFRQRADSPPSREGNIPTERPDSSGADS